jgi:hypothetical protein
LLEGGVDRSGAGSPRAVAAALELLDDLVSVRRLLGEEHENRGSDVAAGGAPAVAKTSGTAEAGEPGITSQPGIVKGGPSAPVPFAPTALDVLADVMVESAGGFAQVFHRLLVAAVSGSFSCHVVSLLKR